VSEYQSLTIIFFRFLSFCSPIIICIYVQNSTMVPSSGSRQNFEEDRKNLRAIIEGNDVRQAVLSEEYIKFIVRQSSDEAGQPKKLGEGFFGVVFQGKDPMLRGTFAVKTIRTYVIDGGSEQHLESARETFQKEQKVRIFSSHIIILSSSVRLQRPGPYICRLSACVGSFPISPSERCTHVGLFVLCNFISQLLFGL
jgi:hypothetical protein